MDMSSASVLKSNWNLTPIKISSLVGEAEKVVLGWLRGLGDEICTGSLMADRGIPIPNSVV